MEPADIVEDRLHDPTQCHDGVVDLTVADVERVIVPGRVDFGGGELTPAETRRVTTARRNPDDDYEWWTLPAGQFLLALNESLSGDGTAVVQPRDTLLERGASHPTLRVDALPRLPLSVGGAGIKLKENARVATVVAVED
jgi:deoxycytidine triphosphate deaminase